MTRIKENVEGLNEEPLDQISHSIFKEDFVGTISMVKSYNSIIGNKWDAPRNDSWEVAMRDFVTLHRVEYKTLQDQINSLKLRVKRCERVLFSLLTYTKSSVSNGGARVNAKLYFNYKINSI